MYILSLHLLVVVGTFLQAINGIHLRYHPNKEHMNNKSSPKEPGWNKTLFKNFSLEPENNYFHHQDFGINEMDKLVTNFDMDKVNYLKRYSDFSYYCRFDKKAILEHINRKRMKHNATALNWSSILEAKASEAAKNFENADCPPFTNDDTQGEIRAYGDAKVFLEEEVIDHWYEGAYFWNFNNMSFQGGKSYNFKNFMQLLWNSSSQIGCGRGCCNDREVWVCKFAPTAEYQKLNHTLEFFFDYDEIKKNLFPPIKPWDFTK